MSGRKYTPPNYQQMYQQQLNANRKLETRNQQIEQENRRQQAIRDQLAESENRRRQEQARFEQQRLNAEKEAAESRSRLHAMQQSAIEQMDSVRSDLQQTQQQLQESESRRQQEMTTLQGNLDALQWDNQQLHQLAQEERAQIQQRIQQQIEEGREFHQVAQEERRQLDEAVKHNEALIQQNRTLLDRNRQVIEQRMDHLINTLENQEERLRLSKMRTAHSAIDSVYKYQAEAKTLHLLRYEPERYDLIEKLVADARQHFQAGDYDKARDIANAALEQTLDAVTDTRKKWNAYETARQNALAAYDRMQETLHTLDSDEMNLWHGDRFEALREQSNNLSDLVDSEHTDDMHGLRAESERLLDALHDLESALNHDLALYTERKSNAKQFIQALSEYQPLRPEFEASHDPRSDIVIKTSFGPTVRLRHTEERNEQILMEFKTENSIENRETVRHISKKAQDQGFANLGIQNAD